MPHLLVERKHLSRFGDAYGGVFKRPPPMFACLIEASDVVATVLVLIGSVYFLPHYARDMKSPYDHFLLACNLFIWGSLMYCVTCLLAFMESAAEKGVCSVECAEHGQYLLGSVLFLAGSVLYKPSAAFSQEISVMHHLTLHQESSHIVADYCRSFMDGFHGSESKLQLVATFLFIAGSMLFTSAAFMNALSLRSGRYDDGTSALEPAITMLYFGGSMLFTVGSVAFVPHLGCGEALLTAGAWAFIIGTASFLVANCLSLTRTILMAKRSSEHVPISVAGKA